MRLVVIGTDLPGRMFCDPDGMPLSNVHVGVQIRSSPEHLTQGDAIEARWELDINTLVDPSGQFDFRGRAVQGGLGDRFVLPHVGQCR